MIINTAYGPKANGKYYAQTCCDQDHLGGPCDCQTLGEDLSREKAKALAQHKAGELDVPCHRWL